MPPRHPTEQERRLWAFYTQADQRLPGIEPPHMPDEPDLDPPPPQQRTAEPTRATTAQLEALAHSGLGQSVPAPPPPKDLRLGATAGVDANTVARFRRGRMPIDATLDLHGQSQHDALHLFLDRLAESRRRGHRVLCVITGHGLRPRAAATGEAGVLRQAFTRWINLPEVRPHILIADRARPENGGQGAFVLLLKRERG